MDRAAEAIAKKKDHKETVALREKMLAEVDKAKLNIDVKDVVDYIKTKVVAA